MLDMILHAFIAERLPWVGDFLTPVHSANRAEDIINLLGIVVMFVVIVAISSSIKEGVRFSWIVIGAQWLARGVTGGFW
jgi:hypothetical protein